MNRQIKNPTPQNTDPLVKNAILTLVREALFGIPAGKIQGVDWDAVLQECSKQHLVTLLVAGAKKQEMSADAQGRWNAETDRMLLYNAASQKWHTRAQKAMDDAGIPCVVIKGLASAAYYPQPILRGAGDVDILVRQEDMEAGGRVLRNMGLLPKKDNERHESHISYCKPGVEIELHWQINGTPTEEQGETVRAYLSDLIDASVSYICETGTCQVPSALHHATILLIHTARHLTEDGTSLRHLCDWAVFAKHMGEDAFEQALQKPLKEMGLWRLAQIFTDLSTRYLGLPLQRWAGVTDADYADRFLNEFFAAGYFGIKDNTRGYENTWYTDPSTGSVSSDIKMRYFIRHLNIRTRIAMPITARVPLLLPVGWAYLAARYCLRVRKGQRPKIRFSGVRAAGNRSELYSEWHLFEPEEEV